MSLACVRCGRAFLDVSGQLPQVLSLAESGRLTLVLGCGGCGALFFPDVKAPPALAQTAAAPPRLEGARRYSLTRVLGEGGMGRTHVARDLVTERDVCVKQLHPGVRLAALQQEWQALSRLEHPNIVKLLDFYEDQGRGSMVMELVSGPSLGLYLQTRGALPEPLALELSRQLAEAIAFSHERSVIHRDLKPGNLLLSWEGLVPTVKVLDFGLAIVDDLDDRGAVTGAGGVAGTPFYMAPEQYEAEVLSPGCDVYALGLILAEMACGELPYQSRQLVGLAQEKARQTEGVDLGATVSPAVRALVRECTLGSPSRRPSARDVASRLAAMLPSLTGSAVLLPSNLGFDASPASGWPPGWSDGREFVPGASGEYRVEVVPNADPPGSRSLRVTSPSAAPSQGFGTVMQRCAARHLAGLKVRLSARVRAEHVRGWAGLWLRADDARGSMLHFDNMHDRPVRGSTPWQDLALEALLPHGTERLNYGVLLVGEGSVSVDDFSLTGFREGAPLWRLDADALPPRLAPPVWSGPLT